LSLRQNLPVSRRSSAVPRACARSGWPSHDFAFPRVAGQDIGISRCLDRLYVTIADAAYTEHQSVLPQFLPVAVEIDGHLPRAFGRRLQRSDQGKFPELRQSRRRKLKLELDF
jgi:hypothetical protein